MNDLPCGGRSPTPGLGVSQSAHLSQPDSRPRIGIDIGGVIIADGDTDDEIFFSPEYLSTPAVPGALEAIAELGTWATCYIVSKVGTTKQRRCRQWLFAHQVPTRCQIPPERWHFSASRAEKGLVAQQLELDGFVDDHLEVLAVMPSTVRCRILFGVAPGCTEQAVHAPDWSTALKAINSCLRTPRQLEGDRLSQRPATVPFNNDTPAPSPLNSPTKSHCRQTPRKAPLTRALTIQPATLPKRPGRSKGEAVGWSQYDDESARDQQIGEALRSALGTSYIKVEYLDAHRVDHRLGTVRAGAGSVFFFKAFAAEDSEGFATESAAYAQLQGRGLAPSLVCIGASARLVVLEFDEAAVRLSDLGARAVRRHLPAIPTLYASLIGMDGPRRPRDRSASLKRGYGQVGGVSDTARLPRPEVVLSLLDAMPSFPTHGDFQPSNVLAGSGSLLAIDFESYGWDIPALDVARTAYNPLLPLTVTERMELAEEMLAQIVSKTGVATSSRQFAAACIFWAVECASYFNTILHGAEESVSWFAEARSLASEPLVLAAELWQR